MLVETEKLGVYNKESVVKINLHLLPYVHESSTKGNSSIAKGPSISYVHKDIYLNLFWSELKTLQNTDKHCSSIIRCDGDNK